MSSRLLSQTVQLHDVRDVEALCGSILGRRLGRMGAYMRPDVKEDALTYLIGTASELAVIYRSDLGLSFSTYVSRILWNRVTDWYRAQMGDTRYRCRCEEPEPDRAGERCLACDRTIPQPEPMSLFFADGEDDHRGLELPDRSSPRSFDLRETQQFVDTVQAGPSLEDLLRAPQEEPVAAVAG